MTKPQMPAENMLTSISKPALTLPSQSESSRFIVQAASGPRIMAPMNIWIWPSWLSSGRVAFTWAMRRSDPAIAPKVAMLPTTPPRMP